MLNLVSGVRGIRRRWPALMLGVLAVVAGPAGALWLPAGASRLPLADGAVSFRLSRSGPNVIRGFMWDIEQPRLSLAVTVARDQVFGLERTSAQAQRADDRGGETLAAVNGDFYFMRGSNAGATIGVAVSDGELLNMAYSRPAFVMQPDGRPTIRTFRTTIQLRTPNGTLVKATRLNNARGPNHLVLYAPAWGSRTRTNSAGTEVLLAFSGTLRPNLTADLTVVGEPEVGRGNMVIPPGHLVLSGHGWRSGVLRHFRPGMTLQLRIQTTPAVDMLQAVGGGPVLVHNGQVVNRRNDGRHSRTALGYDGKQIVAVTVDGRRPGYSIGMTLAQLASFMKHIGCREAINLDGGGSTSYWERGALRNLPSDGGERSVANAVALLRNAPPTGGVLAAPPSQRVAYGPPAPVVIDRVYRGAPVPLSPVAAGRFAQPSRRVVQLVVQPAELYVLAGEPTRLAISGRDEAGLPAPIDAGLLLLAAPTHLGRLTGEVFTAHQPGTSGMIHVQGYGAESAVPFHVARTLPLEEFEPGWSGQFQGYPLQVTGALRTHSGGAVSGSTYASLEYDFGPAGQTRAAYLRLSRRIDQAAGLRLAVRGDDQPVWLRATIADGSGAQSAVTLFQGTLPRTWTAIAARLPEGLTAPLTLHSLYLVAPADAVGGRGRLDLDRLELLTWQQG